MAVTTPRGGSRLKRIPLAAAISLASLGLIALSFATVRKPETARPAAAREKAAESSTPWHVALGNVVVLAPDLGFKIAASARNKVEPARVAARIEAQLISLRQLYRQQSENDPTLLGAMTLQLTLGNSGKVEAVKILKAQLKDREFRKAVAAEAARWNFHEIAPAATVIECPLLFVRQGMDITTLVNWEKTLRAPGEEKASSGSPR
jgi:hypothetical protein